MRTGIVGLGEIGQHHLAAIRDSEDAELVAVCDLDPELAGSSAGDARAFSDVGEMLAACELDSLAVCLPHSLHVEVAVEAIAAGCNVLLEKPMAVDVGGCDRIAAAAQAAGVAVGISHNQLHYAPHVRLRELIDAESLGALRAIYARLWIGDRYRGWREDPAIVGGGLLMDAGVHRVYLSRALGGPVEAVEATMDVPRAEERFEVTFHFASGATGLIQGSYFGPEGTFDDRIDVLGDRGAAVVSGCEAYFEGDLRDEPQLRHRLDGAWADDAVSDSWAASVARSVSEILAAFAAGREPLVGPTAGRETVGLIEAAYVAAETGGRVETDAILDRDASERAHGPGGRV
ncbi:MAG: Gfo/Idh/MocA family oxidoreductase [Solirubrobacterales bacterium]|nr:Gfo/Idh/MocA family oxidoreductase [Solirubrobacterales bacterium]